MANYTLNQISGSGTNGISLASQNTITLSSIGAQGSGYATGIFNFDEFSHRPDIKKYEVYEISQDLLALSVCWARYRKMKGEAILQPHITKLLDGELFRLVNNEDIELANTIRDYYSKKIMVWKLKNINLTPFRQDLNTFIHSEGKTFKETMLPLVYRLPEFYEYDVEFEKMSFEYNKEVKLHATSSQVIGDEKNLKFIKQLTVNSKRLKKIEYWFSDNYNNLVQLNVENSNPLNSLLQKVITQGDITLFGRYLTRCRDGSEFLRVEKYNFV